MFRSNVASSGEKWKKMCDVNQFCITIANYSQTECNITVYNEACIGYRLRSSWLRHRV
jgi:hypothetical protein